MIVDTPHQWGSELAVRSDTEATFTNNTSSSILAANETATSSIIAANATGATANTSEPETSAKAERLEAPPSMKMKHLAATALASEVVHSRKGDMDFADTVAVVEDAREVLEELDNGLNVSAERVGSLSSTFANQTAEAALLNGEMLTASDVANSAQGQRGEDLGVGPGGNESNWTFQGDMVPASAKQLALFQMIANGKINGTRSGNKQWVAAGEPWHHGEVNYCFASDVSKRSEHIFEAAAQQYMNAVPCLKFRNVGWKSGGSKDAAEHQACKESPAVFVISHPKKGCYSYVGMVPQFVSQQLQLNDPACLSIGTAIHELGHALGMAHEQSRPDRDDYIRVNYNNIDPRHAFDFDVEPNGFTGLPYDYLSIMHYDAFAFSLNGKPSLERADGSGHTNLGNRVGLSHSDVTQVAAMYLEENQECGAMAIKGMGCVDKPDESGVNVCESESQCHAAVLDKCCGCGGGVKVQCYENADCPQAKPLAAPEGGECIQDRTDAHPDWKEKHGCVFTNACSFSVGWHCPDSPCHHTTGPGGLWIMSCNGKPETEICKPGVCTVMKM